MPCPGAVPGKEDVWYCLDCEDGPFSWANHKSCPTYGHLPCALPGPITPPKSPLPTSSIRSDVPLVIDPSPDAPELAYTNSDFACDVQRHCKSKRRADQLEDVCDTDERKAGEILADIGVLAVQSVLECLLPASPDGSQIVAKAPTEPAAREGSAQQKDSTLSPLVQRKKGQRQRSDRIGSKRRRSTEDSEEENNSEPQDVTNQQAEDGQALRKFACPFFKNNPHRFGHLPSCSSGYTDFSRLKAHLTRRSSPHEVHQYAGGQHSGPAPAANAPSADDQCEPPCDTNETYYPAEGIAKCIRNKIPQSRRGPTNDTSLDTKVEQWQRIYRTLFGPGVLMPSCYHEDDDFLHSIDPGRQPEYRAKLVRTLTRRLPKALMEKFLLYHMASTMLAEKERIKRLLAQEGVPDPDPDIEMILSRGTHVGRPRTTAREAANNAALGDLTCPAESSDCELPSTPATTLGDLPPIDVDSGRIPVPETVQEGDEPNTQESINPMANVTSASIQEHHPPPSISSHTNSRLHATIESASIDCFNPDCLVQLSPSNTAPFIASTHGQQNPAFPSGAFSPNLGVPLSPPAPLPQHPLTSQHRSWIPQKWSKSIPDEQGRTCTADIRQVALDCELQDESSSSIHNPHFLHPMSIPDLPPDLFTNEEVPIEGLALAASTYDGMGFDEGWSQEMAEPDFDAMFSPYG